jgi:flagellin
MTSIHTNSGVMAALATSRSVSSQLVTAYHQASTGLRIDAASDNASYWSIATTMRSDARVLSTVQDALQMAAGMADVAYTALDQTAEVLSEIRAKLVLASNEGVDPAKVQLEIDALIEQTVNIANSASYGGTSWVKTSVEHIFETSLDLRQETIPASFVRSANGHVRLEMLGVDLLTTSLYNERGGGILDRDPRHPGTIGGIRYTYAVPDDPEIQYSDSRGRSGIDPWREFDFVGPMTLSPSDFVSFDVVIDKDNPDHGLPGPLHAGISATVVIDRQTVADATGRNDGVIVDYIAARSVLSQALSDAGIRTETSIGFINEEIDDQLVRVPNVLFIGTSGLSGLDGSYFSLQPSGGTVSFGTLGAMELAGNRGATLNLNFQPFKIYRDVEVNFGFTTNSDASINLTIDRTFVDDVLGKDSGQVDTADEMATLMQALLVDRPDLSIDNVGGVVTITTTPDNDRLAGAKSRMSFSGINVNIEPVPQLGLKDVDIATNPEMIGTYLQVVEGMLQRTIDGAADVGAVRMRIDIQSTFLERLTDSLERGIGTLVDADMSEVSARLQALEVQRQLTFNAISITSARPQALIQLFN